MRSRTTKLAKILMVAMVMLMVSSFAFAVEYSDEKAQEQLVGQDASQDVSLASAQAAMEKPQPPVVPQQTIDEAVDSYLSNSGYGRGWNDSKETFISVGVSFLDCEDPSYDTSFINKRSLKNMEAILDAKAQIIEFVRTDMSVLDQASTPGTDLNAEFKDKIDKLQNSIEAQRNKLAKMLKTVDATEAAALQGANFGDRLNRLMDAAIKKLDDTYSSEQIDEKKRKKYEKAKARYQKASTECSQLEAQLKTLTGSKTESLSSKTETLSKMPLMGATVIAQFESWDEESEQYSSAVVVMWSKKMEALVRAFISGEVMKVAPGKKSLTEYINGADWSCGSGGRRFRDNNGEVYFLGIGSAAVGKSSSSEKRARGIAAQVAKKEVATAIFADVSSHKIAEAKMESYNGGTGKDTSVAAESFASELQQTIKNRNISGLQSKYLRKVKHPISGQYIYVAIYAVSGQSARNALMMEESNYISRIMDVKSQQKMKGTKAGHDSAVESAKADTNSYNLAKNQAGGNVSSQANQAKPSAKANSGSSAGAGASSGVYTGAGQDDASW
ncbi:hypothetical protein [Maridesulfovibrio frigidus]|uniref:hypothetical protein n=1 Tax=Maridesulfovibrio frigidus TaxID=340956 RepID=UPI0004E1AC0C|nr:hypothetical protein [Maridesulfovibrio frigidus]